jgi:hypothetical protein
MSSDEKSKGRNEGPMLRRGVKRKDTKRMLDVPVAGDLR